ncbi:hypothetical protein [Priestia megaterium]|uniref:hypothetical protein n=1 Tax=Priestia megaterium TaxID=1404 RepID=UPI0034D566ED
MNQQFKSKANKIDILIILMILGMAFENFKILNLAGAPVKITHVVFALAIIKSLFLVIRKQEVTLKNAILLLFLLVIPLIPIYRIYDTMEFFKTYIIYVIIVSFMFSSYEYYSNEFKKNHRTYIFIFLYMMLIIQVLGVIQFVCMNFFDYFFLEGFWGNFQFHNSIFGMQLGFYRAYSIFHEPSLFGWMSTTSFALCIYLKRRKYFRSLHIYLFQSFNIIAVAVSVSASSLLMLIIIYSVSILLESDKPVKFIVKLISSVLIFTILWRFSDIFDSLQRISKEVSTSGSSGYERLNTPMQYVISTLENFTFFGRGLGQEGNVDAVGTIGLYKGVNNSVFGIFVNFGLTAFLYLFGFIYYFTRKSLSDRGYLILITALFGIYVSTGAYLSLDTFVVFVFVLFIGNLYNKGLVLN